MGKMNIIIKNEIEDRFRRTVANTKGFKKGNISIALEEAIELWIKEQTKRRSSKD
jgi:hypothetical protein